MKFGLRTPSLKGRISARTSLKRVIRHRMGLKAPKGLGVITNPKRALYNRVYNKTSVSVDKLVKPVSSSRKGSLRTERNDTWNTGNFKSREDLLKAAKESNIVTNGKSLCQRCGSDIWAIANVKILFIGGDAVFCQSCGRPGLTISEFNSLRNG